MKFKVLAKSYLFGELVDEGAVFDYPDDKLPRNEDGSVKFDKLSQLEPIEKPAKPEKPEKPADAGLTYEQKEDAIKAALEALDKSVDSHWTQAGLPDVSTVKGIVGFDVSRKEIDAVAPNFLRPAE